MRRDNRWVALTLRECEVFEAIFVRPMRGEGAEKVSEVVVPIILFKKWRG